MGVIERTTHPRLVFSTLGRSSPKPALAPSATPLEPGQRFGDGSSSISHSRDPRFESLTDLVGRVRLQGHLNGLHGLVNLSGDQLSHGEIGLQTGISGTKLADAPGQANSLGAFA